MSSFQTTLRNHKLKVQTYTNAKTDHTDILWLETDLFYPTHKFPVLIGGIHGCTNDTERLED